MAEGYAKLFSGITKSTLWTYDAEIRIVWIHMMAEADENGIWIGTAPGLAQSAGIPLPKVREALATFLAPDPDSGSKEFDGRRIEPVDRGWRLLNHAKYRALRSREQKLEADRIRIAEKRETERPMILDVSHSVANGRVESQMSPIASASASSSDLSPSGILEAPPERAIPVVPVRTTEPIPAIFRPASRPYPVGAITDTFLSVFNRYTNQAGRVKAAQTWQETAETCGGEAELARTIGAAFDAGLLKQAPFSAAFKFRPTFETFLAGRRWEDPIVSDEQARARAGPGENPVDPYANIPRTGASKRR